MEVMPYESDASCNMTLWMWCLIEVMPHGGITVMWHDSILVMPHVSEVKPHASDALWMHNFHVSDLHEASLSGVTCKWCLSNASCNMTLWMWCLMQHDSMNVMPHATWLYECDASCNMTLWKNVMPHATWLYECDASCNMTLWMWCLM